MQSELEKLKVYILIKWIVLAAETALATAEFALGAVTLVAAASSYLMVIGLGAINLTLAYTARKEQSNIALVYLALFVDVTFVIISLYFNGGMENTWLFGPVLVIFISGYLLDLTASLSLSTYSFLAILLMFFLESSRLIPHFNIYGIPELYWKHPAYIKDYLLGMFFLYYAAAFASGYLNQIMLRTSTALDKAYKDSENARNELETSRKAMLNVMDDLENAREKLDQRVRERTAQLEEAKAGLEAKVTERTADLEASRKAIMHMMKDLKEDVAKLQVVDRMKTEFLSLVSHELRTPLTPIKGYLYLILSGKMGEVSPPQKSALEIVSRQSEHLHSMIDNILDISRFELGKPIPVTQEPISIKQIIDETAEAAIIQAKQKGVNLVAEIKNELPTIVGDSVKLKRVVINLVGNAIKFTPEGGEVRITGSSDGEKIRVEVSDNGVGISKENIDKIFEKFYQVDSSTTRSTGGIGMGLTICKELVALHGGKVWAESEGLGKGSRFTFELPIKKEGSSQ